MQIARVQIRYTHVRTHTCKTMRRDASIPMLRRRIAVLHDMEEVYQIMSEGAVVYGTAQFVQRDAGSPRAVP